MGGGFFIPFGVGMCYTERGGCVMIVLYILLAALCIGMPVIIILKTNQSQKRGCGRGCATCGNRDFCHRSALSANIKRKNPPGQSR